MQYGLGMLAALLLASCSSDLKEEDNDGYRLSNGKVDLTISVTLPQPETVKVSTRTTPANWDSDIANMDLLIFDKDAKFMKRVKVESGQLTVTETGVSFTVKLDATPEKRIIHLVANGRSYNGKNDRVNFDEELVTGRAESDVISKLKTVETGYVEGIINPSHVEITYYNDIMRPVMWGRFVLDNGITAGTARQAQLLRATACVKVQKGVASAANQLDNFEILDVTVNGAALRGFLAPADCTGTASTPAAPNPVPDTRYLDARATDSGSFNRTWPTQLNAANFPNHYYYMYERHNTKEDYMSVIIYASYKTPDGSTSMNGFYRIALTDGNGIPLDAIRNHRYNLTIIGVSGPGYAALSWAINSSPSNALKVEITDDQTNYPFIAANGENTLAMSNNEYVQIGNKSNYLLSLNYEICNIRNGGPVSATSPANAWLEFIGESQLSPYITPFAIGTGFSITAKFSTSHLVLSPGTKSITNTLKIRNQKALNLPPLRITWIPDIASTFGEDESHKFYVHDLVKPTDKNWNIRILNPSSTPWLRLRPSDSPPSPGDPIENSMVTELGSKYNSHAYLYVSKGSERVGHILKTSVSDGKPVVTRILIAQ